MTKGEGATKKAKIGRNEPCACGSGRKYKRCCGAQNSTTALARAAAGQVPKPEMEGTWGLSGTGIAMSLLRASSDPNYPGNSADPAGLPGAYKVSFVLSRPNYAPIEENKVKFDDSVVGDSHLQIANDADTRIEISHHLPTGDVVFYGYANEKGMLSKVEVDRIQADGFGHAVAKAYNVLAPVLSRYALLFDIPLHVFQTLTTELATQNFSMSFTLPFRYAPATPFSNYEPEKAPSKFASLYREALNSNSPNYQFLCYYKIVEGIRRIRSERTTKENQEALARGEKPPWRPRDFIPATPQEQQSWLSALFGTQKWSELALRQVFPTEAAGKKINELIREDGVLDTIRNKIAHAVMRDESKETFSIDDALHNQQVTQWLPLCKAISRYLLKAEFPQMFR
jgi:hypothetical protein